MFGWCGRIARIDLSANRWWVETPDPQLYARFIGGRGLAGHYLRAHVTRDWDDPAMPLLFFSGPLVNSASPTSGRMTIMSRSPLTGTIGDASVGGSFGTQLKRAGFDGLIIAGRAAVLTAVEIDDGRIRLRTVPELAGLPTDTLGDRLKSKGACAGIGPAAENRVRFASIMVDRHFAAGRNGLGLAFAAKNLKYITVRGSRATAVHDPQGLAAAREEIFRLAAASPVLMGPFGIAHFGTGALYDLIDARRMMPTDNFRRTHFDAAARLNAHAFKAAYPPRRTGCRGCHILCKKKTGDGDRLPEFESMSHFSALLDNTDLETVMTANRICNRMGMDTISAAATLACYAEIEGRRLAPDEICRTLTAIGNGEGLGLDLGQGAVRFARDRGRPEAAMAVKGQELPAYDPRGAFGMALAYALSSRGGCHLRAYPISHEILRKPVATDRFSFAGKARIIKLGEDLNAVIDSLTACKFIFFAASLEEYAHAYTAVTGLATSAQDLLQTGARICYHERIMNAANGFDVKDDDLPARFFTAAGFRDAAVAIDALDRRAFETARAAYYTVRGLDRDGRPHAAEARRLGLAPL